MSDYLVHRQPQEFLIPLDALAEHAMISAVAGITDPNHERFESFNNTETTSDHKRSQAIHVAQTVLRIVREGLDRSGYLYFDSEFLGDPNNSGMHSAYRNARVTCPDDLDAALERAWAVRRSDWEARAAIPGRRVQPDDNEVAADVTEMPTERLQLTSTDGARTRGGVFAVLKAKIKAFVARKKNGH